MIVLAVHHLKTVHSARRWWGQGGDGGASADIFISCSPKPRVTFCIQSIGCPKENALPEWPTALRCLRPIRHLNIGHSPQLQAPGKRLRDHLGWGRKSGLCRAVGAHRVSRTHLEAALKMLRREARLRREYLYRKAREEAQRSAQERKERLRRALEENRLIPTELRREALALQGSLEFDDAGGVTSHVDDEYRWAGVEDPKVMITTSRDPSSRLKMFAKELKLVFPGAQRMNRGRHEVGALVRACKANGVTDLLVVHEYRGTPVGLIISHLPFGPTAYFTLCNVVMRHDIPDLGTMSEAKPHLITHGFSSRLGKRVSDILRYLFPVPKDDSHRVITFANQDDYISFRHHVYKKTDHRNVELTEVGPRFELKLYMIRLGTLEQEATADVEWRWHPYTNTARKRVFLSAE
ncbi:U3 small nucleolar ribonucleoprotein protein IMP4 isoform X5 [Symphalangus syndactylus]|uniref:U3 small nucleolar ribonucleoprotein protein IMP4 isoform X5 n=1 Tax=Symphalangus syndactylus TaxID=9590 RepID=UPI002442F01F|nr:U3 small nucleolar ribonucleoprotein protein IMP4 isoform X5 [Symphalangus syndactylus]